MKVGIIGTGVVGQTLGIGLTGLGHEVKIGSREPDSEKLQEWLGKAGEHASTGTMAEAAQFGDIVILATLWAGTEDAINLAGPQNLAGKVLIDANNSIDFSSGSPELAITGKDSASESVQRWLPDTKVVKAFNIVPAALMIKPDLLGELPDMFIAGNDADAKKTVTALLTAFGWPVIDMGDIHEARLIEALGMLWIKYYFRHQDWQHAFKLIRKS